MFARSPVGFWVIQPERRLILASTGTLSTAHHQPLAGQQKNSITPPLHGLCFSSRVYQGSGIGFVRITPIPVCLVARDWGACLFWFKVAVFFGGFT